MIKKVMLLDDDYATNVYHEIIIKDEKIVEDLVICTSVDEAIDKLSKMSTTPELIFLDMNLPVKNAWDFLEEYERKNFMGDTKIVILSTTKNPADVKKAEENKNVHAFMTKPLEVEYLKQFLESEN